MGGFGHRADDTVVGCALTEVAPIIRTRHHLYVVLLPQKLIDELRSRASDPRRFVDAWEFAEFRSFPPARLEQVQRAEDRLGFPLPEALRILYLEVANGGFGPGYGIIGIDDGATDDRGANVEQLHQQLSAADSEVPDWEWREQALPFCYLGCQVYSCVLPDGSVIDLDGYDWRDDRVTLADWLSRWTAASPSTEGLRGSEGGDSRPTHPRTRPQPRIR